MKTYLLAVTGTVMIAAIISAIAPEGKISSAIKTAAKIVCVIAVAEPIAAYFVSAKNGNISDYFEKTGIKEDESFIQYCSEAKIAEAEKLLEEEIAKTYGVAATVRLDWVYEAVNTYGNYEEKGVKLLKISVNLHVSSAENEMDLRETANEIEKETEEKYGVETAIKIS